jgi:hypothetical protein
MIKTGDPIMNLATRRMRASPSWEDQPPQAIDCSHRRQRQAAVRLVK